MSSRLLSAVTASFHATALQSGAVTALGPVFLGPPTLAKKEGSIAEEKLFASEMYLVCKTPLPLLNRM